MELQGIPGLGGEGAAGGATPSTRAGGGQRGEGQALTVSGGGLGGAGGRALTALEFQGLAAVPLEAEWFANIAEGIFTAHQAPLTLELAQPRSSLIRFAWLSVAASIVIIGLKAYAYWVTGSVGLLSDALESIVNLVSACVALVVLTIAARPADEDHPYGHDKAEYFSSGFEGGMILIAALGIAGAAINRLLYPQPLQQLGLGLSVSLIASVINFVVARILLTAGRRHDSITLEADAHHLITDVWTSIGVLVGVGAVSLTGWTWLDPAVALGVAVNIVWTGVDLLRRSALGLMDTALPAIEQNVIREVLDRYRADGIQYHALRTRRAAARRFISMHVLVPGAWTVQRGHDLLERIEGEVRERLPHTTITIHLEPLEDPRSWSDAVIEPVSAPANEERTSGPT